MYLSSLKEETLLLWKQSLEKDPTYPEEISYLKDPKTRIYFSFFPEDCSFLYEAVSPSSHYWSFRLDAGKQVSPNPNFPSLKPSSWLLLALLLAQKEKAMDPKEREALYSCVSQKAKRIASLSEEEAKEYRDGEEELSKLRQELPSCLPDLEKTQSPEWSYSFLKEGKSFKGFLYLKRNGERKKIGNPFLLLDAYKKGKKASFSSFAIDFSLLPSLPSFEYLLSRAVFPSSVEDFFLLQQEDLPPFLFLLPPGSSLSYSLVPYLIPSLIEGKLCYEAGQGVRCPHPLEEGDEAYFGKGLEALFKKREGKLLLLRFPSPYAEKVYRFYASHPSFPESLLSSELTEAFLPYLSKKDCYGELPPRFEISYSLALTSSSLKASASYSRGEETLSSFFPLSEQEKAKKLAFLNALSFLSLPENGEIKDKMTLERVLSEDLSPLSALCHLSLPAGLSLAPRERKFPHVRFSLKKQNAGSFLLLPELSFSSSSWSKEEISEAFSNYSQGKAFYQKDGVPFLLSSLRGSPLDELKEMGKDLSSPLSLSLPEALRLNLSSSEEGKGELKEILSQILDYRKATLPKCPVLSLLRPYQKEAVQWMSVLSHFGLGGVLGDEMGLGKTLESIAFLSTLEKEGPILIVAPKSVLYNWKEEFARFDPEREAVVLPTLQKEREQTILSIQKKERKVYLTSYDSLRNDVSLYQGKTFSCLLLDEAQSIANAFAKKSLAVKEIQSECRFALTGTPIQNSLLDLWSIFDFLLPGYFPNYSSFKENYGTIEFASLEKKKRLQNAISPFLLRRTKQEVLLDLPPFEEKDFFLSLTSEQEAVYQEFLSKARGELTKEGGDRISILAALTRLRQICVDPSLFLPSFPEEGVKISYLAQSLLSLTQGGHKALIFSSFVTALKLVGEKLDQLGLKHYLLEGSSSAEERIQMANSFNSDPSVGAMLISLKAGGTGLNLTGADTVFLLDPWWNLSAEEQAFARAHRIGQKKSLTVFRLIASSTIEERMLILQKKKKGLGEILSGVSGTSLTKEDFAFLLS